jgi:uncharacterized protein YjiS (DUF1127 family)
MASLAHPGTFPAPHKSRHLVHALAGFWRSAVAARRAARLQAELEAMSDATLAKRGLTRADIAPLVAGVLQGV